MNRLAVESLLQTNPDAEITIHYQDPPDNEHWRALESKVELRAIDLPGLLSGLPPSMTSVVPVLEGISSGYLAGRSNILRYLILYREGGIYLDFDTLTVKDYLPLLAYPGFIGEEAVFRYDDDRVSGKFPLGLIPAGACFGMSYYLSLLNCRYLGDSSALNGINKTLMSMWSERKLNNAVLACEVGSPFFAKAIALVSETNPGIKYALGPILMNRTWSTEAAQHMQRLGTEYFYAIPPSQTFRFFYGPAVPLPSSAYSIHWCSSNHKALASTLTLENLGKASSSPTLFHKLAYEVIRKGL